MQTLTLLQALLATTVEGAKGQKLVGRIDEALSAMTAMLNTLLDINQIEVGAVKAEPIDFPVNELLDRVRAEPTFLATAAGLQLRVLPCATWIRSDAGLLEQMIRNLLSNAIKYTQRGRVLVGCRRAPEYCVSILGHRARNPEVRTPCDLRDTTKSTTPRDSEAAAWDWGSPA